MFSKCDLCELTLLIIMKLLQVNNVLLSFLVLSICAQLLWKKLVLKFDNVEQLTSLSLASLTGNKGMYDYIYYTP
jgi:hypothetical protein